MLNFATLCLQVYTACWWIWPVGNLQSFVVLGNIPKLIFLKKRTGLALKSFASCLGKQIAYWPTQCEFISDPRNLYQKLVNFNKKQIENQAQNRS